MNELTLQLTRSAGNAWVRMQVAGDGSNNIHWAAAQQVLRYDNDLTHGRFAFNPADGALEIFPNTSKGWGGYIDFHYAGSSENFTSRLIDMQDHLRILVPANKQIKLEADANLSTLVNSPTVARTDKSSKAIATCGWVNTSVDTALNNLNLSQFAKKTDLDDYVTLAGTQTITGTKIWHANNVMNDTTVMAGAIQCANYRVIYNGSTWGGLEYSSAVGVNLRAIGGLYLDAPTNNAKLANPPNESASDNCIASVGYVKENSGKVKSVDYHFPDDNGNISFELATDSLVKTDGAGNLTTIAGGTNGTISVVSDVTWNGTQLVISRKNLEIEDGLIMRTSEGTTTRINTVTYN